MRHFLPLILLIHLFSCGNSPKMEQSSEANDTIDVNQIVELDTEVEPEQVVSQPLAGFYVGRFEAVEFREDRRPSYMNKINISIDEIRADSIFGHSVVAGNDRPFSGTYTLLEEHYDVEAREPGDDRYDGLFRFKIFPDENRVEGTWEAYNKNLAVYKRQYNLQKRSFEYDPNLELPEDIGWAELYDSKAGAEYADEGEFLTEDVLKLNPSKRLLKKEEVENLYKGDLEIIRHSIYARHGYSFKNRKARFIFDEYVDWYVPVSTDIRAQLTSIEKQNIDLLKRYEQHADRYYDVFGR